MHRWPEFPRTFALVSLAGLLVMDVEAQLVSSSPFLPVKAASPAAPTASAPLEYRGMIDLPGEGLKFRIVDPVGKKGGFLKIDERNPNYDFVVKQYDAARDMVTVDYRGQPMVLAPHESKVTSSGVPQNIVMNAIPVPASVTAPVAISPTPAQEAQRLEAVAAEVARRRALREQAAEPSAPVIQPAPPNPSPPNNGGRGPRGGGPGRGRAQ